MKNRDKIQTMAKMVMEYGSGPLCIASLRRGKDLTDLRHKLVKSALQFWNRPTPDSWWLEQGFAGQSWFCMEDSPMCALSFSHGATRSWAVLGSVDMELGIDVVDYCEFSGQYPMARAFTSSELVLTEPVAGSRPRAAALLWSVKEALVKALGTGFGQLDFLDVSVTGLSLKGDMLLSEVSIDKNRGVSVPSHPKVFSFMLEKSVVSIAVMQHQENNSWVVRKHCINNEKGSDSCMSF